MRTCPKCNAANQPTRKFCIRCGTSLLVPLDERPKTEAKAAQPKPEVPELGRVVTGKSIEAQKQAAAAAAAGTATQATPSVTTQDQWVRPSSVSRDRVRTTTTSRGKSEMEKAKEIFAKAMEYGTDEEGSGVIETRMLRASEVRELMRASSQETATTPSPPPPTPATPARPTPRPVPTEVPPGSAGPVTTRTVPTVKPQPTRPPTPDESELIDDEVPTPEIVQSFTSSRYGGGGGGGATAVIATPIRTATTQVTRPTNDEDTELVRAEASLQEDMDNITVCPKCGTVITKDSFEYTPEIFSAMGEERLKQARFFVVQGQYEAATKALNIAKALFTKAGDNGGISMANKLADSLTRGRR